MLLHLCVELFPKKGHGKEEEEITVPNNSFLF